jgi:hypothetical protein
VEDAPMSYFLRVPASVSTVLLLGLCITLPASVRARAEDRLLDGVRETVEGKTYEEWTVAFFRWAYGVNRSRSPVTDTTGKFAAERQSGPVWFLGGNLGGTTRRKVTVPSDKRIFSPVIYAFPKAASAKAGADNVADMGVTLDGKSLGDLSAHRVTTRAFSFTGPEREDALHPSIAGKKRIEMDGYWFMLKPLPPGKHTLRIRGKVKAKNVEDEFELDITYELTVEERK